MKSTKLTIVFLYMFASISLYAEPTKVKENENISDSHNTTSPESPAPKPTISPKTSPQNDSANYHLEKKIKVSVLLYVNSADKLKYENVTASNSGTSESGTFEYGTEPAPGLGIELTEIAPNSWGWAGGISHDSERKFKNVSATLGGTSASATYSSDAPKLSVTLIYLNAVYMCENFYLPFGFNYSFPDFKRSSVATGTLDTKGALGAQVGVGYKFSELISMELLSRVVGISQTGVNSGINYDFGTGYLAGGQLTLKFSF